MRTSIPNHRGRHDNNLPPNELLEPSIDRTEPLGDHWMWDGDFAEQAGVRFAVFPWRPPNGELVRYAVARVLWTRLHGKPIEDRRFYTSCGLSTCVNPAHFTLEASPPEPKWTLPRDLVLPDGLGARVVQFTHGTQTKAITRMHIQRDDTAYVMCMRMTNRRSPVPQPHGTQVTCEDCLKNWKQFGYPLEALP